jgi:hypothetical protein
MADKQDPGVMRGVLMVNMGILIEKSENLIGIWGFLIVKSENLIGKSVNLIVKWGF